MESAGLMRAGLTNVMEMDVERRNAEAVESNESAHETSMRNITRSFNPDHHSQVIGESLKISPPAQMFSAASGENAKEIFEIESVVPTTQESEKVFEADSVTTEQILHQSPPARRSGAPESLELAPLSAQITKKQLFDEVIARIKLDYDLINVLRSHGINLVRGASGYLVANCPFPNHEDSSPSFKIKIKESSFYRCYGCQAKGDVLDFIRDYHHLNTVSDAINYLTGKTADQIYNEMQTGKKVKYETVHYPAHIKIENQEPESVKSPEETAAELANATDVYIALLGLLEIDPFHEKQLKQRGISLSEAYLLGYRSFPSCRNQRIKICKSLRQAGYELKNVPGFFRLPRREFSKGQWCMGGDNWGFRDLKSLDGKLFNVTGLLIPTRDLTGQIRRLKVRNDAPGEGVPPELAARFPERYMAFSSRNRDDGAGAGAWVHVARPIYQKKKIDTGEDVLWITEGEIKADISALFTGETTLGMPGVGQCPELAISLAVDGGFTEICVAMDAEEKPHVKLAIAKLIKLAKENNLACSVAVWDPAAGKGLDDLLAGGGAPEVLSPDNWWERLSRAQKTYVLDRITGRGVAQLKSG